MSSDTVLNFVNKTLRITGDYEPLATVIGSPANIADRIVDYMNIVLDDITRKIEFRELITPFISIANGVDSEYITTILTTRPRSSLGLSIGTMPVEELAPIDLNKMRDQNLGISGTQYYARISGPNGEAGVDMYPTPVQGTEIRLYASQEPTKFTVADASVTEVQADDLILLGTIAHMDSYSGMERGYMQLYEASKNRAWRDTYEHQQLRVQPESYR